MTPEQLRRYVQQYRDMNFAGGMIPFDCGYAEALDSGLPIKLAQTAGTYRTLNAFVNFVEAMENRKDDEPLFATP